MKKTIYLLSLVALICLSAVSFAQTTCSLSFQYIQGPTTPGAATINVSYNQVFAPPGFPPTSLPGSASGFVLNNQTMVFASASNTYTTFPLTALSVEGAVATTSDITDLNQGRSAKLKNNFTHKTYDVIAVMIGTQSLFTVTGE